MTPHRVSPLFRIARVWIRMLLLSALLWTVWRWIGSGRLVCVSSVTSSVIQEPAESSKPPFPTSGLWMRELCSAQIYISTVQKCRDFGFSPGHTGLLLWVWASQFNPSSKRKPASLWLWSRPLILTRLWWYMLNCNQVYTPIPSKEKKANSQAYCLITGLRLGRSA